MIEGLEHEPDVDAAHVRCSVHGHSIEPVAVCCTTDDNISVEEQDCPLQIIAVSTPLTAHAYGTNDQEEECNSEIYEAID